MSTKTLNEILRRMNEPHSGPEANDLAHAACAELEELRRALLPFAFFAKQFDAQPLRGIADEFYGIHNGTPWEASLKVSDCRRARKALED